MKSTLSHSMTFDEWLVGGMDDVNDVAGNELIFYDDNTLNWVIVHMTLGVGEPRTYIRYKTMEIKEPQVVLQLQLQKFLWKVLVQLQPQEKQRDWLKMKKNPTFMTIVRN